MNGSANGLARNRAHPWDAVWRLLRWLTGSLPFGTRGKIFLMLMLALMPVAVMRTLDLNAVRQAQVETAKANALDYARDGAETHGRLVAQATSLLAVLAQVPFVRDAVGAECHAFLREVVEENPWSLAAGTFGKDGARRCSSGSNQAQTVSVADRPWFQEVLKTSAPVVSDLVFARSADRSVRGKPVFVVARPVLYESGELESVLTLAVDIGWVRQLVEQVGRKSQGSVLLIDRQGVVLAESVAGKEQSGAGSDRRSTLASSLPGLEGTSQIVGPDGRARLLGYATIPAAGVKVVVSFPMADIFAAAGAEYERHFLELVASIVLAALLAWVGAEFMLLRWISRLRETAERLGEGDFAVKNSVPAGAGEFAVVGNALEMAAANLGRRDANLREAERRASESNRYLLIAERMAHVGYWQVDLPSLKQTWSDEVFRIYGLKPASSPPSVEASIAAYHPEDRGIVEQAVTRAIESGAEFELQVRLVRPSGEIRNVLTRGCAGYDEAGVATMIYGVFFDVTELRRAELEAQAANRILLMAEEVSQVGNWRVDIKAGTLTWSEQVYRMHGLCRSTYQPSLATALEAYHPDDRADVTRLVSDAIETKRPYEFQKRILHSDGTVREVLSRGLCEVDPVTGDVVAIFGVIMDVTALRTVERELQAKSSLLEATLDTIEQGLLMIGEDGRVDVANRRFAELLDIPSELLARPRPLFDDLLDHLDAVGEFASSDAGFQTHVRARGAPFTLGTYERRRPNGTSLEVRTNALPGGKGIVRTYTDTTERREAELALQDSEARYRLLVENASDMIFRLDRDMVRQYISPACREILGYEPEDLVGRRPVDMIHPDDAAEVGAMYAAVLAGRERAEVVNRIRHKDGHWIWAEAELRAIRDTSTGEVTGILGAVRNVSERKRAEAMVAASEARFRMLAENTADLVTHIGPDGRRLFASPASRDLLGYEPEELVGGRPMDLAHPEDWPALSAMLEILERSRTSLSVQYRARRKDGTHLWVEATGRSLDEGGGLVLVIRDIDRRKKAEDELDVAVKQLKALASSDGLTGLDNRRSFDETLERELARAERTGMPISLILADVDHFKAYNDTYGHPAGDACLKQVASALKAAVRRPGDFAARYGGEEFVAVLSDTALEGAAAVAEYVRQAVAKSCIAHEKSRFGFVTISIGVVTFQPGRETLQPLDLIRRADEALYSAKASGRNAVRVHEPISLRQAG